MVSCESVGVTDPLYTKRAGVVSGSEEPPAAAAVEGEAPNGIPDFWLNVLRAEETTSNMVSCIALHIAIV